MTKICAELGIEVFDISLLEECKTIFAKLGYFKQATTKKNSIILNYRTSEYETFDLETVSDNLCTIIENAYISEILSQFYSKNKGNCYMSICFIFNTDNDACIILNERIINLASRLCVKIQFDGI